MTLDEAAAFLKLHPATLRGLAAAKRVPAAKVGRAWLSAHMKPMATFAVETGLRQANVLGLTWDRVDLKRKLVWVEGEDAKAGKAIAVPLSVGAVNVLKAVQGQHKQFVFTYRGKPVKEIKTAFVAACVRAGVGRFESVSASSRLRAEASRHEPSARRRQVRGKGGVVGSDGNVFEGVRSTERSEAPRVVYTGSTWHGLRHTWATWHVQNGTPLDVLQKLGGWADLRMVMNYAHHAPSYLASFTDNASRK